MIKIKNFSKSQFKVNLRVVQTFVRQSSGVKGITARPTTLKKMEELRVSHSNGNEESPSKKHKAVGTNDYGTFLEPRDFNAARSDYLQWEDYFMALAFLAAKRSKDPCTQVGACIVDTHNKVVGLGYNGFPIGCSDQDFPWKKGGRTDLDSKYMYVCHAEMNAILNKITADITGCTMYVALFPCAECAKIIIQSRISTIVYMSDKHSKKNETIASKKMLDAAGITYRQHTPKQKRITIDFDDIDWIGMSQVPPSPAKN